MKLSSPRFPGFIDFKSVYVALWEMNYFSLHILYRFSEEMNKGDCAFCLLCRKILFGWRIKKSMGSMSGSLFRKQKSLTKLVKDFTFCLEKILECDLESKPRKTSEFKEYA